MVIDEAVTLAKRYASDEAGRLVNGILGRIYRRRLRNVATEDSLSRAEELLAKLEAARGELDRIARGGGRLAGAALEILGELSELAKAVEEELERAKRAAEADAAQS